MSDLHLGHRNIPKYRPEFSTEEEHSNLIYENLASNVTKRDTLILLGDVAFTDEWLNKLNKIQVQQKILILGNHDTERLHIKKLVEVFDKIHSMLSYRGTWLSHAPIHPEELRRKFNIHGHTHKHVMPDTRYLNVCVEHTEYKPISFQDAFERLNSLNKTPNPV